MTSKNDIKKTLFKFNQESNILLRSNFEDLPLPLKRFAEQIDADPRIKSYLDECIVCLPDDFDAALEVETVLGDYHTVFGPFSTCPEIESAQVYSILKELLAREVHGRSIAFYGYAPRNFQEMYKGFLDQVMRRLIVNIGCHLSLMGIEMGLDTSDSVTNNFNGSAGNIQLNQAVGESIINATQSNGIDMDSLEHLIVSVKEASSDCSIEVITDIQDGLEAIRSELSSEKPKRGILKGALTFLKSVDAGTQFSAAVTQVANFIIANGINLS